MALNLNSNGGRMPHRADDDDADLEEIRHGLAANIEGLSSELLGPPTFKSSREWRWHRKGSLALVVRGEKRGRWLDREGGDKGDALGLIRHVRGCSFREALDYARGFLGMSSPGERQHQTRPRPAPPPPQPDRVEEENDVARLARARATWADSIPVADGDLADQYLQRTRGIPRPADGWPEWVRFNRRRSALVVAATDAGGAVVAVQVIYLTSEARKRPETQGLPKQSFGIVSGNVVRLHGKAGPLLIAEGPETGLSVWAATGRETWIALGSMAKVEISADRPVVLCADDDPREAPATKALRKAVGTWRATGHRVVVAMPWPQRREDKSDFNDAIREAGPAAVAERIARAIQGTGARPAALSLAVARSRLDRAVGAFFTAAQSYIPSDDALPPVHAIQAGVGLGKSDAARRHSAADLDARSVAARKLAKDREQGGRSTAAIFVPTHKLGTEQAYRFMAQPEAQTAGLTAAVWRGRTAADPDNPGETMCQNLAVVKEVQEAGLDVEENCCRRKVKGKDGKSSTVHACPFLETCAYQRQKQVKADVVFAAHEMLFTEKPAVFGDPAFVIVDEAPWPSSLAGVEGRAVTLSLDALTIGPGASKALGRDDARAAGDIYSMVRAALAAQPDGPVRRDAMLAAGIDAALATDGHELTWRRKVDPKLRPDMTAAERKQALQATTENRTVIRTAWLFRAVRALVQDGGPEASGWVHLATEAGDHGPVRVVKLRERRSIRKGWIAPTLLIDATLDAELVKPLWPQLVITAEIEAEAPHQRIRQLVGRDITKSALAPDEWHDYQPEKNDRDRAELKRRASRSAEVRAIAFREARAAGAHLGAYDGHHAGALIVAQKVIEDAWRAAGAIPSYIDLGHHNAMAGRDEWKGIRSLVVVGRTLPRETEVERMAEALTGAAVTISGRYDRVDAEITLRDGSTVPSEAWRHPDAMAERVRWRICEGELLQIIGRARGTNRTAETPVDVLLLTDRPLPLAVDDVVTWEGLAPSPEELMLAAGGVVLNDAADAARAYPDLWATPAAAKQARWNARKARSVTGPLEYIHKGGCYGPPEPLRSVQYQRVGAGCRPAVALYDPAAVPDPAGWLTDRLGELRTLSPAPSPAAYPAPKPSRAGAREAPHPVHAETARARPPAPSEAPHHHAEAATPSAPVFSANAGMLRDVPLTHPEAPAMPDVPDQPGLDPGLLFPKVPPPPRLELPLGIVIATPARRLPPSIMLPRAAAGDAGPADTPHFAAPDLLLVTRAGRIEVAGIGGHAGIVLRAWPKEGLAAGRGPGSATHERAPRSARGEVFDGR